MADHFTVVTAQPIAAQGSTVRINAEHRIMRVRQAWSTAPSVRIYRIADDGTETQVVALTAMTSGVSNSYYYDWTTSTSGFDYVIEVTGQVSATDVYGVRIIRVPAGWTL